VASIKKDNYEKLENLNQFKGNVGCCLFYIAVCLYCCISFPQWFFNYNIDGIFIKVVSILYIGILSVKYIFFQNHPRSEFIVDILYLVVAGTVYLFSGELTNVGVLLIFILSSKDVNPAFIIKNIMLWIALGMILNGIYYIAVNGTWITNAYPYRGITRFEVGNMNSNYTAILFFSIMMMLVFSWKGISKKGHYAIWGLYFAFILFITQSLSCVVTSLLFFSCIKLYEKINEDLSKLKVFSISIISICIVVTLFFLTFSIVDIKQIPGWKVLHRLTSNRLVSSHNVMAHYSPFTLWGQHVDLFELSGYGKSIFLDPLIDVCVVRFGVVWSILFLSMLFLTCIYFVHEKQYILLIILSSYIFYGAMENIHLLNFCLCPFLMYCRKVLDLSWIKEELNGKLLKKTV